MVCVKTFLLIAMVHVLSMSTEEINRCMTENDEECQLPFSFGGKTFSSCMLWNKNGSRASVCMTKINSTTHVHLKYPISTNFAKLKFCSKECVVEETVVVNVSFHLYTKEKLIIRVSNGMKKHLHILDGVQLPLI